MSLKKGTYLCGPIEVDLRRRELRVSGEPTAVGDRGIALIEVLIEAAGALVSKDILIRRVWAGAAVEDNTLEVHISTLRKALGSERRLLRTSYRLGYRLLGHWVEQPAARPTQGPQAAPVYPPAAAHPALSPQPRLPLAGSSLIGRTSSLHQLAGIVASDRLVTLTGLGGIGKTRLALEIARQLSAEFGGQVHFIELASLADPALVPSAVAIAMGLELGGALPTAQAVARALGEERVLIVLDNCEHLIDAAAQLAETIMRGCAQVSLLVTSREGLRIEGERVFQVPALDVPPPKVVLAADLRRHSAVQLFLERVRNHTTDREPSDAALPLVAAICRRLDGIPLAIEFAAARAASLGLKGVHDRLGDRFNLLAGGRRTALPRQQTMRATLDWSFDLLSESERRLLRRLSIMPGGFSLEAARVMAWEAGSEVVENLASLVGKALVTPDHAGRVGRWRLLETVRAYAMERLVESSEIGRAARCNAEFCRDLFVPGPGAQQLAPNIGRLPLYWLEIDNVRAALEWAFSEAGDAVIGVALTAVHVPFLLHTSMWAECRERAELAVARLDGESAIGAELQAQLYVTLGLAMIYTTAPAPRTWAVLLHALEIASETEDVDTQLQALWALLIYNFNYLHNREARVYVERFAALAKCAGEPEDVLMGYRLMGAMHFYAGDHQEARHSYERYVAQVTPPSRHRHLNWVHYDGMVAGRGRLARVLCLQGLTDQAQSLALANVEQARMQGHLVSVCLALGEGACPIAIMTGEFAAAERYLAALTQIANQQSFSFWTGMARCLEGQLLVRRGESAKGVTSLLDAIEGLGVDQQSVHYAGIVADLIEGMAALGAIDDAVMVLERAILQAKSSGVEWHMPELLRLEGVLALKQANGLSELSAERHFAGAAALARRQGALFWEIRAVVSLAQLHRRRGDNARARLLLEDILKRVGDGQDTSDSRAARALWTQTARPARV